MDRLHASSRPANHAREADIIAAQRIGCRFQASRLLRRGDYLFHVHERTAEAGCETIG
jgi:hypothetical protein